MRGPLVEARIGQLLGEARDTTGRALGHDLKVISHDDRSDYRELAKAAALTQPWPRIRFSSRRLPDSLPGPNSTSERI
jgi:hypothetical protein